MQITYKEFFEKSKHSLFLQELVECCIVAGINVTRIAEKTLPNNPSFDAGEAALKGIAFMAEMEGIEITNPEEITAEYMADVLNSYRYRT